MATLTLNKQVQEEIYRLSQNNKISSNLLEHFAYFVIETVEPKKKKKSLSVNDFKKAIYHRFNVNNTQELKKSGAFKMATDGMEKLDFRLKSTWKMLYRKFIGILPDEENQEGYGCINGINIFNYFKPWQVFNLDPKTATKEDVKNAYYQLAKIYHPDNLATGDRAIFEQLEIMYKSILAKFKTWY